MILRRLTLQNFKQYRQLELNFREGLVGIAGKNGAGKSTIFEAILLCLFGQSNSDKAFYRSSWATNKDPVDLSLEFEINQKVYTVKRSFRGKDLSHKADLYDYKETLVATQASVVNQEVTRTLGLDREAFSRSIFSGQKELGQISNTKGEERKRMVRKMVGLDKLDKIQQLVRENRNLIRTRVKVLEEKMLDKKMLQEKKDTLKDLKNQLKQVETRQKEKSTALKQKEKDYLQAKKKFEKEQERFDQFMRFDKALEGLKVKSELQQEDLTLRNKNLNERYSLQKELPKLEELAASYEKATARKEELRQLILQNEKKG